MGFKIQLSVRAVSGIWVSGLVGEGVDFPVESGWNTFSSFLWHPINIYQHGTWNYHV